MTGEEARPWKPPRNPQTVRTIRTGSSGAVVTILRCDDELIAVKTARAPRVSAARQQAARETIAPHFGEHRLPRVLFAGVLDGEDVLVTECPTPRTLADLAGPAGRPLSGALDVWTDLLDALQIVWTRSARPGFVPQLATRNHGLRWERAVLALRWVFAQLDLAQAPWRHLVVNDVDHGPLDTILARLADVPPPEVRVACHGDPQPRNVLVTDDGCWHLVDWEWAGLHQDWRMMCSHLAGWWNVESVLTSARGTITSTRSAVLLTYQPPLIAHLDPWVGPVFDLFRSFTNPEQHEQDLVALANHIAMLLVREIPRAMQEGRRCLVAPLLGEAIRFIAGGRVAEAPELFARHTAPVGVA